MGERPSSPDKLKAAGIHSEVQGWAEQIDEESAAEKVKLQLEKKGALSKKSLWELVEPLDELVKQGGWLDDKSKEKTLERLATAHNKFSKEGNTDPDTLALLEKIEELIDTVPQIQTEVDIPQMRAKQGREDMARQAGVRSKIEKMDQETEMKLEVAETDWNAVKNSIPVPQKPKKKGFFGRLFGGA